MRSLFSSCIQTPVMLTESRQVLSLASVALVRLLGISSPKLSDWRRTKVKDSPRLMTQPRLSMRSHSRLTLTVDTTVQDTLSSVSYSHQTFRISTQSANLALLKSHSERCSNLRLTVATVQLLCYRASCSWDIRGCLRSSEDARNCEHTAISC